MGLIDFIDDKLFDIHWYFTVEREANKSMKRFNKTMDEAIAKLEAAAAGIPDEKTDADEEIAADKKIVVNESVATEEAAAKEMPKTENAETLINIPAIFE